MLNQKPHIAVLLAAYNGIQYIGEQIQSILGQEGVDVKIYVRVDHCEDGTARLVQTLSGQDKRVELLVHDEQPSGAGKNFYRLFKEVDLVEYDYVALADQDDIWLPRKLVRAHEVLSMSGSAAYSCNMKAFWPDGRESLVLKSQPQVRYDYLFESGGAGCTYVFSAGCAQQMKAFLMANWEAVNKIDSHDWLFYAWCRANSQAWIIDEQWWILYRQHGANQVGANHGWKAVSRRLGKVRGGWYRNEVEGIARLVDPAGRVARLASSGSWWTRLQLIPSIRQLRRSPGGRFVLLAFLLTGLF